MCFKLQVDVVADETPAFAVVTGRRALIAANNVCAKRRDLGVFVPRVDHSQHVTTVIGNWFLSQ